MLMYYKNTLCIVRIHVKFPNSILPRGGASEAVKKKRKQYCTFQESCQICAEFVVTFRCANIIHICDIPNKDFCLYSLVPWSPAPCEPQPVC